MPHVTISLYPGHSHEEKERISEKMKEDIIDILGVDIKSVSVCIREVCYNDWKQDVWDKEINSENVELYVRPGYLLE